MSRPSSTLSRRRFLTRATLATTGLTFYGYHGLARRVSPNEKLNLGFIGVAGQAEFSISNLLKENIVALCDVDDTKLGKAGERFPQAKRYNDFRELVDQSDLDAIVIATPDHTHAVASMAVLRSGRHLYCEKPLTRTISECRAVTELAHKKKLVTQIGTQIHAGTNYRRVVELIQSGAIGPVREVHVWVGSSYGGKERPTETPPIPAGLHYDLWVGPVEYRPYSPEYVPFNWRHWWAFGGGSLADFGCHFNDLPHWALGLSHPLSAEVVDGPKPHPESTPPWLIVRYEYPARGEKPPATLYWYHGGRKPGPAVLEPEIAAKWGGGILFIGSKGMVLSDYGRHVLLPEKQFEGFVAPNPFIPDSIGHHNEWVKAIKEGGTTMCNFDYSGPLTEVALLGNVAFRTGRKLDWDSRRMRARGCAEADQFIRHHYRKGWKL